MEVNEFLSQNEVKIASSAKELKKMLDTYVAKNDYDKAFKRLLVTRGGEQMTPKSFLLFVKDNEDKVKMMHSDVSDITSAVCYIINEAIGYKESYIRETTAKRVEASTTVPDYYIKGKVSDVPVDIFDIVDGKANEYDKDLYKCFCTAGEHIVFTSKEMTKLIIQNNDGSLAFGNDLLSMNEGALFDCICKNMQTEFSAYKAKLQAKLASLTLDDMDSEEHTVPVIEKVFIEEVPCSFRHIVNVVKRYRSDGEGQMRFDGFFAKPNKKIVDHLDFDSFISALAKNFQKLTRGALKHQEEYKTFSNRLDEAAVSHWILPSEHCWKKAELPDKWKDFFKGKAEPRILQRLFWYIGAMQDAKNFAEQALIISDGGGTGKSTMLEVLSKLFPPEFFGYITNSTLDDKKEFALSERRAYEHHCLILDEYDGKSINSPVFKNLVGTKVPISMGVKNKQAISHNFKGTKMIVVSNEVSVLETHAYRRRVIPVSLSIQHKARDAYNEHDKEELLESGKAFLDFCYKVYKLCKLTKANGEYYVLPPALEEKWMNGEELGLEEEVVSMKAISNDEAVNSFFNVHDYEESDISLDFNEFIQEHFMVTDSEEDKMTTKDVIEVIEELANDEMNGVFMQQLFDGALRSTSFKGKSIVIVNVHNKMWYIFKQCLKSMGAVDKVIKQDGKAIKAWLKLKPKA